MKISTDLTKQYKRELKSYWTAKQKILPKEMSYVITKELNFFVISGDQYLSTKEFEKKDMMIIVEL
jgi:hypothetical protein